MNRLARIAQSATPSISVLFRKEAYGRGGVQPFLRDVLALANASFEGPRYIITGAEFDRKGRKHLYAVDSADFSGNPAYAALVEEHIEPRIELQHHSVMIDGKRVGIYEIPACTDRPYMMRIDFSETLRRGDAYAQINHSPVKLGRGQLQALFEKKFQDAIPAANIEIGFPGTIIHKDKKIVTFDLANLPSIVASAKLQELIAAKAGLQTAVANTAVARLTHARLFGSDSPYEERSTEELIKEMQQLTEQHRDEDEQFLFNRRHTDVQIVVNNHGDEPLQNASLTLVLPGHPALHVAEQLPKIPKDDKFIPRLPAEQADYPDVTIRKESVRIVVRLDDVLPGAPVEVFTVPLRICAGHELKGRRLGIQYSFSAQNLRSPAKGRLRLFLQ